MRPDTAREKPYLVEYIYALADPRYAKPNWRYIGRTKDPARRLVEHCAERAYTAKGLWIAELREEGLEPNMQIIEAVPYIISAQREALWINGMLEWGVCDLTNTSIPACSGLSTFVFTELWAQGVGTPDCPDCEIVTRK